MASNLKTPTKNYKLQTSNFCCMRLGGGDMAEKRPLVFNVQKFSVHDGPGIRTTIFFKGCPLACPWCHNPESQHFEVERMERSDGGQDEVGTYYSVAELVRQAVQDQIFYERSGGGVTLSGGEVLAQPIGYIADLVRALAEKGMKSMDKLTTGIAYGTSAGSAGYWFLQLLDKVTPSQWAAIGVLGSLVFGLLTYLTNLYFKIKEDKRKAARGG